MFENIINFTVEKTGFFIALGSLGTITMAFLSVISSFRSKNKDKNGNLVQGTNNNVIQGTGNQLNINQVSDSRASGEFKIPDVRVGLSYHKARKILMEEGWIPLTQRSLYPGEENSLTYGNGKIFWDLGYWEIVSCTGTGEGFCRFEWADPSQRKLVIITTGIEDPTISTEARVNRIFLEN